MDIIQTNQNLSEIKDKFIQSYKHEPMLNRYTTTQEPVAPDRQCYKNLPENNLQPIIRTWVAIAATTLKKSSESARKRPSYWLAQWEKAAWAGIPVIILAGLSVGLVTWFQIRDLLVNYGAGGRLPGLIAVAVVVQTGPILTSIICAARLGAGIAAELATMNLTEETDALESFGVNILEALVAPRVIAATLALPVLTLIMDFSAIGGAMLAQATWGDFGVAAFWDRAFDLLTLRQALPATLKTSIFGFLIATTAAAIGLNTRRDTEAVGQTALKGVVYSIFAVMAADVLIVPMIQQLNAILFSQP